MSFKIQTLSKVKIVKKSSKENSSVFQVLNCSFPLDYRGGFYDSEMFSVVTGSVLTDNCKCLTADIALKKSFLIDFIYDAKIELQSTLQLAIHAQEKKKHVTMK